MRATLLEADPETTAWLEAAFAIVPIHLTVVRTLPALQRAAERTGGDDFLIVDCSLGHAEDLDAALTIVRSTMVEVHVIYARAEVLEALRPAARVPLKGMSVDVPWRTLLAALRGIRAGAASTAAARGVPTLTANQRRVHALVGEGLTDVAIAGALRKSAGTVKTDIARIKRKLGVTSREELRAAYRWTPHD